MTRMMRSQRTHSVEHGQHRDADIGKDGEPHRGQPERCQHQHSHLDTDGKDDILTGNAQGAPADADGIGYLRRLVVHQYDVGSLDGSIAAQTAHGDTDVGTRQHGGIVDAVAHEGHLGGAG